TNHLHGAQPIHAPHRVVETQAAAETAVTHAADQVDISPEARLISQIHDLPEVRADRVAELRAQIAAGVYETEEKISVALDRLMDELA
ncbi:MAG: flagellar biosynthesis anti-sigma factor FlgM, partial [Planctomycetota bacterium]